MVVDFKEMRDGQQELHDAHPDWEKLMPSGGKSEILNMIGEIGEVIAIIQKKGSDVIMNNPVVRENLCTEICDVLMFMNNAFICYDITPEEISKAYIDKHNHNMHRNYAAQNQKLYEEYPTEGENDNG
ncbi:MAG: nucleotide pyrophosphohydrolase [Clostridia bacterium]|nr:nucleotide pyrophosphohydrolase [Clostridia bacterium]